MHVELIALMQEREFLDFLPKIILQILVKRYRKEVLTPLLVME